MRVFQSPRVFLLRPEIFSITLGILWSALVFIFTIISLSGGGASDIIALLEQIYYGYAPSAVAPGSSPWHQYLLAVLIGFFWAFLTGYLLGFLIAYFYLRFMRKKVRNASFPVFEMDPDKVVNVLQQGVGKEPYTIVFVANPRVFQRVDGSMLHDPIIDDHDYFAQTVFRCLGSLLTNELTRLPDIFQQLRLITVFDPNQAAPPALCEGIDQESKIIAPMKVEYDADHNITQNTVFEYVKEKLQCNNGVGVRDPQTVDLVFLLTGSREYTRSAARFTDDDEARGGQDFSFTFYEPGTPPVNKRHCYYAKAPGMAAISALDDRLKTPIHEFAHAMSSVENGAVDDEYIDDTHAALEFRINKKFRGGFIATGRVISELDRLSQEDPDYFVPADINQLKTALQNAAVDCVRFETQKAFEMAVLATGIDPAVYFKYRLTVVDLSRFMTIFRVDGGTVAAMQSNECLNYTAPAGKIAGAWELLQNRLEKETSPGFPAEERLLVENFDKRAFLDNTEAALLKQIEDEKKSGTIEEVLIDEIMEDIGDELKLRKSYQLLLLRFANVHSFPIPKIYGKYHLVGEEPVTYYSDRGRTDKELNWASYSPGKPEGASCIMDIEYLPRKFDGLLFDFMYDRLMAKISRNHQGPFPC